jgi:heptaprenyl diphosphate synthase
MNVKKLTALSLSVALAMILSFVESQIPPFVAIPGVKIGLSNIVTVFLIYSYGWREAGCVTFIRVVLSALLFGSFVSLLYSICGAALSFAVMLTLKKTNLFSVIGVSVAGGVFHNVGQIACACVVMENAAITSYLPPLIISGTIAGIAVGILSGIVSQKLKGKI